MSKNYFYLGQIWDKLGVSKRLVVSHVGVETCCIHQEGLKKNRTEKAGIETLPKCARKWPKN